MKHLLLAFSLIFALNFSYSQMAYVAANGVNTASTYTDLGSNGSAIITANNDDANSTAQNIGFNFFFNGNNFTQFVLNTNGAIKLGAAPPATVLANDIIGSTEANMIYPMYNDLDGGTAPEYRVYTNGIAPNRVCTIQFKNVRDYFDPANATAPQFQNMDFQIKLYETSNNIEFVYGTIVAGGATSAVYGFFSGIKGSSALASINVTKASTAAWSAATFIDGGYTANAHNIRNTVLPDAGRTYRFVSIALPNNDAKVSNVYTLGKIPVGYGTPHVISAIIVNAGGNTITNLGVTLNITGANVFTNLQTIPTLASGDSVKVDFASFSPTIIGVNSVSVSVAADDNNTNNTLAVSQTVNANTFSYADNASVTNSIGYGTGAGIIANKYTVAGSALITGVNVYISNIAANTGNTIYGVVLDAAGNILGQSPNYVIAAGDLGANKSLLISVPPGLSNAVFYVGLAQTTTVTTGYFPLGSQTESPGRAGAYYIAPLAGGSAPTENATLGRFMIEAVVGATPVPVKLTTFNGKIQNSDGLLSWATSLESNGDRFEIEKSLSGGNGWLKIGSVKAVGNSSVTNAYHYKDAGLGNGNWMYRLKIIDKDGKFTYSPIVVLQVTGKATFVLKQNYPNPVTDVTIIRYELAKDARISFQVYSMDGRRIKDQQIGQQSKGAYNFTIDVKSLSLQPGTYIYRMIVRDKESGEITIANNEFNVTR